MVQVRYDFRPGIFQMMCKLDGGTLAEINNAAENTFLQAQAKVLGGKRLLCLRPKQ